MVAMFLNQPEKYLYNFPILAKSHFPMRLKESNQSLTPMQLGQSRAVNFKLAICFRNNNVMFELTTDS